MLEPVRNMGRELLPRLGPKAGGFQDHALVHPSASNDHAYLEQTEVRCGALGYSEFQPVLPATVGTGVHQHLKPGGKRPTGFSGSVRVSFWLWISGGEKPVPLRPTLTVHHQFRVGERSQVCFDPKKDSFVDHRPLNFLSAFSS